MRGRSWKFWPRDGLVAEVRSLLLGIRIARLCTPATALQSLILQGLHVVESFDGQGLVIASFADQGLARLDLVLPGLDAFRSIPTKRDHLRHTVVAAKDPITQLVKFIQLYAALFGFESAVYAFGR